MDTTTTTPNMTAKWWQYLLALLLPIVGFIIAIVFFARGAASQGVALLLTSALGIFVSLTISGLAA